MRGFDQFMNIVLDKATDEKDGSALGMVVRFSKMQPVSPAVPVSAAPSGERERSLCRNLLISRQ